MERGPLLSILASMKGSSRELNIYLQGEEAPVKIENVEDVSELMSSNGIHVTTKENEIWLDASHVSLAYHARH